jgi:transposase
MAAYLRTLKIKSRNARKRLIWHRDHAPKPYLRERCAAILKIADGHAPYAVARSGLLKPRDPDTIYAWLNAYEADGFDGLVEHPHGGYRGPHLDDHRAEVAERLRQPPDVAHLDPRAPSPAVAPCRYRLEVVRQF